MAKEGGPEVKLNIVIIIDMLVGTLDFAFVLTWPTSSWSSCSTTRGNCGMLRNETRLVVMPELQGHGIGPKMAEIQGDGIGPKIQGYLWCTTENVRQFLGKER